MTNIEQLEKAMQEAAEAGVTMLKKSQMSFDFTSTNPHQPHHNTAYQYANNKGTVVNVAAKVEVKGRKIYLNGQHHAEIIGSRGRDHKGRPVSDFDIKFKDGTFLSDKTQGKWAYMVDVVKDIKANPEILGIGATQEQPTPTEHPAATALKEWLKADREATEFYDDNGMHELPANKHVAARIKKEHGEIVKRADKALKEAEKHANKMTDAEWEAATAEEIGIPRDEIATK